MADPQYLSRMLERDLATLLALALPKDRDMMTSPERSHACLSPCMALARAMSLPIEQRCNPAVRQKPSQLREQLFDFDICRPAMLAGAVLDNAEWRVVAALPVHLSSRCVSVTRTTISLITARKIRLRDSLPAFGCSHARGKSAPRSSRACRRCDVMSGSR
jgi:hypothetical protein